MTGGLLVRNRNFRLILSANAVSNLGDGVSALALPWLASLLTRDAVLIGVVAAAAKLPWFLCSLPVGVWTDRADRRQLMIRADVVRLILTTVIVAMIVAGPALPLSGTEGIATILGLAAVAFLIGIAEVFHDNAAQTALPSVVDKADLERANGQMWSAETIMGQFAGPPLAGIMIGIGIAVPFGFDAATFAIAAGLAGLMVFPDRSAPAPEVFRAALAAGMRWMRAHPTIPHLAVMLGCLNFLSAATLTVLVLYGQEVLGLGASGYGFLMTAAAAGGVTGGVAGPALIRRYGATGCLFAALALFGAAYGVLGLTSSSLLAAACLFVEAFGGVLWNIVTVSYRQRMIPDDLLGRVNSIYRFLGWGTMPLGSLAGGGMVMVLENGVGRGAALHVPFLMAGLGGFALLAHAVLRLRLD